METQILCVFNVDILFDITSLVVAILKHSGIKYQHDYPDLSVLKEAKLLDLYVRNIHTVKPQSGAMETLKFLQEHKISYTIHIEEEVDQMRTALRLPEFSNLSNYKKLLWFDYKERQVDHNNVEFTLIKNHNFKNSEYWSKHPNTLHDLRDIDWSRLTPFRPVFPNPQYKVTLKNPHLELSYQSWFNVTQLEPINLKSKVINGFGRGGTQLGIPTANLEITTQIEHSISSLLPGVYFGPTTLHGIKYVGVMSIGFNPYYDNSQKTLVYNQVIEQEVHLIDCNEQNFYGEILEVSVEYFVRVESDFKEFSYLIEFINNDVQVAIEMSKKRQLMRKGDL